VEGGGTFFVFYRERAKRTKKVGQNLQESGSKPSRKWVGKFKEMEGMFSTYFTRRFNWLFAFSGRDLPTRLPLPFLGALFALWAKGFLGFAMVYIEFFCKDRPFFWFSDGFYVFLLRLICKTII
jgi:hypothetical protein